MRASVIIIVLIATAGLGGCAATPGRKEAPARSWDRRLDSPSAVAAPNLTRLLPPAASQPDADELDEAVDLVTHLRYDEAADRLARLVDVYALADKPAQQAKTIFWLAFCREKQGRLDEAADGYRHVIMQHPSSSPAAQAHDRLDRLLNELRAR